MVEYKYDVIVVGGGVAGTITAWMLSLKNPRFKIALFSHESSAPACSLRSTGIVSLGGIQKGVSDLGDKLYSAYHKAAHHFEKFPSSGIEKGKRFLLDQGDLVEECYLIQPEVYLNQLKGQMKGDFWNERVESIEDRRVQSTSGKIFEGRAIVLAAGAYSKLDENLFIPHRAIEESSIVAGTCGFFKQVDWGDQGMVFSLKKGNLIYRAKDQTLLLGGTTDKGSSLEPNKVGVKELYDIFRQRYQHRDLPDFKEIEFKVGLRHRGRRRRPYWGRLSKQVFGVSGLYKNGWSYSFLAAEEVSEEILEGQDNFFCLGPSLGINKESLFLDPKSCR